MAAFKIRFKDFQVQSCFSERSNNNVYPYLNVKAALAVQRAANIYSDMLS